MLKSTNINGAIWIWPGKRSTSVTWFFHRSQEHALDQILFSTLDENKLRDGSIHLFCFVNKSEKGNATLRSKVSTLRISLSLLYPSWFYSLWLGCEGSLMSKHDEISRTMSCLRYLYFSGNLIIFLFMFLLCEKMPLFSLDGYGLVASRSTHLIILVYFLCKFSGYVVNKSISQNLSR